MAADCPICRGTGFRVTSREDGVASALRCACEREDRSKLLLKAARIPLRYDHCTLESFVFQKLDDAGTGHFHPSLKRAHQAALEWVALWPAVRHGLVFHGPPGTGKTHLAVAVARELVQNKGARVVFYEQRELLRALQGTFDAGSPQRESEILAPVQDAEVLVLDDLGAGRTTEWARDVMHDLIAYRYNEMKPLIITTNRAMEGEGDGPSSSKRPLDAPLTLKERLGDALMSRLYEMCDIVPMQGNDFRIGIGQHSKGFQV